MLAASMRSCQPKLMICKFMQADSMLIVNINNGLINFVHSIGSIEALLIITIYNNKTATEAPSTIIINSPLQTFYMTVINHCILSFSSSNTTLFI